MKQVKCFHKFLFSIYSLTLWDKIASLDCLSNVGGRDMKNQLKIRLLLFYNE